MLPPLECQVLVVGGGPAGIAAACAAGETASEVILVDDNVAPGGQIWRGGADTASARRWMAKLEQSKAKRLYSTRIVDRGLNQSLLAESHDGSIRLGYQSLVLATGARELFLPFPGWTLPSVLGAGGLQALVKGGLPIKGRTVVVAGSGPLLLAVAAYLRDSGARVPLVAEQSAADRIRSFGLGLWRHPGKLAGAFKLQFDLLGTVYRAGCWPIEAKGKERVESVILQTPRGTKEFACDYLACGFGLSPNLELPGYLGCRIERGGVVVDSLQQTTVNGVYCAGEPVGIGGLETSLVEGRIAGYAASGNVAQAQRLVPARVRARHFAAMLQESFRLRGELRELASPETIVCRCEDVPSSAVRLHGSWRSLKLQTRCGMGPCQGRVCGPAVEQMMGWGQDSIRPPLFPASVQALADAGEAQ